MTRPEVARASARRRRTRKLRRRRSRECACINSQSHWTQDMLFSRLSSHHMVAGTSANVRVRPASETKRSNKFRRWVFCGLRQFLTCTTVRALKCCGSSSIRSVDEHPKSKPSIGMSSSTRLGGRQIGEIRSVGHAYLFAVSDRYRALWCHRSMRRNGGASALKCLGSLEHLRRNNFLAWAKRTSSTAWFDTSVGYVGGGL
jgi:hypothetical protein